MKKFINNITSKITVAKDKAEQKMMDLYLAFKCKSLAIFAQNTGEGFVDTALKILISVVVGALLLAGLYLLFQDTILPELQKRITELFDYKG